MRHTRRAPSSSVTKDEWDLRHVVKRNRWGRWKLHRCPIESVVMFFSFVNFLLIVVVVGPLTALSSTHRALECAIWVNRNKNKNEEEEDSSWKQQASTDLDRTSHTSLNCLYIIEKPKGRREKATKHFYFLLVFVFLSAPYLRWALITIANILSLPSRAPLTLVSYLGLLINECRQAKMARFVSSTPITIGLRIKQRQWGLCAPLNHFTLTDLCEFLHSRRNCRSFSDKHTEALPLMIVPSKNLLAQWGGKKPSAVGTFYCVVHESRCENTEREERKNLNRCRSCEA